MNHFKEYILLLNFMAPVFSGVSCIILLLISYNNSLTSTERSIKKIMIVYLLCAALSWFFTFLYGYFPWLFLLVNVFTYLVYLYAQIFFYRLFFTLTQADGSERFRRWHYLPPVIIGGALLAWPFFVPYDVQLEIVNGRGLTVPEGYEAFTRFFSSKPRIRLVFSLFYTLLAFIRFIQYYRRINRTQNLIRKPARWVLLLAILTVTTIISSGTGSFLPRTYTYNSMIMLVATIAIVSQHIILTYHVIRRDYLLYISFTVDDNANETIKPVALETDAEINEDTEKKRKSYTRLPKNMLTRKSFDAYFGKHKPFLDSGFKITTLAEMLDINRTYISNFINETYGVNFNRFVNRCRIKELDRLMKLPSNKEKNVRELVQKAGFTDMKHYRNALKAENAGNTPEDRL